MTRDEAISLKDKVPVYLMVVNNIEYIFKTLSISEYIKLENASIDDHDLQDMIVIEALLYPDIDIRRIIAGTFESLYNSIMITSNLNHDKWGEKMAVYKSRFTPTTIEDGNLGFTKPLIPLIIQICKAFPAYKPEDLMVMSIDDILQRASWADLLLNDFRVNDNVDTNTGETPVMDNMQQSGRKWSLSHEELEKISAEASDKALREEMNKYRRR